MEYIIVENGVIARHVCARTKPEGAMEVPDGFAGYEGLPLAALKDDLSGLKPLSQQIAKGIVELPEGYKINEAGDEFIRMEQDEIDGKYPVKTYAAEGSFEAVEVRKTFDRDGNFGYWTQKGLTEMEGKQPSPAYRAQSGRWVFDLERGKERKLAELAASFEQASAGACCLSSAGFVIDADETANRNVSGLIVAMEANGEDSVLFCAHDNTFHEVTLEQLKAMRMEIITHAQALYAKKWAWRKAIMAAGSAAELEALSIGFAGGNA